MTEDGRGGKGRGEEMDEMWGVGMTGRGERERVTEDGRVWVGRGEEKRWMRGG